MKYVLFATPRFGELVLRGLAARGLPPALVVTNPDRPAGRNQVMTSPPAKIAADELGIPTLQPELLSGALDALRAAEADVFLVAAYGKILKPDLLAIPPRGVIGVHPSLLPRHRGPSPMQQAILDGDTETGVTLFLVDEEVDHGPVIALERAPLGSAETYLDLEARLADLGAGLASRTLPSWVAGEIVAAEQEHPAATFTRKFSSEDAHVSWDELVEAQSDPGVAERVARVVRGLNPEPGAWTERAGVRVKLLSAEVAGGRLAVTEHQVAGKKPSREPFPIL